MPGLLGNYPQFRQQYENPIVKDKNKAIRVELKDMIQPFILRRLKQEVLQDLPAKSEQVVLTSMVGKQAKLYQACAQRLVDQLKGQDDDEFCHNRFTILAEITRLRELCCSPQFIR